MRGRDAASTAQTRTKRRRGRHDDEREGTKSEEETCCSFYSVFFSKTKLTDFLISTLSLS
jgi:hypothetical protein